ncbi:MAG: fatty acid desaturase, partial [Bdellovibrionota bacterium]
MIRSFRTNPRYLEMYHWKMGIGLFAVNCLLLYFTDQTWNDLAYYVPVLFLLVSPQIMVAMTGYACAIGLTLWQGNFDSMSLVEALAALIVTFPVSGLMHSTSHDSMRPRWLNRPVGELMGMFHLVGYPDWKIIHIIHHTYTDDAQLDPHPPGEKSYWEFAKGMRNAAA